MWNKKKRKGERVQGTDRERREVKREIRNGKRDKGGKRQEKR